MYLSKYASVPAMTIVESDAHVIPEGKEGYIRCIFGNACYSKDVCVVALWGDEIIFCTHGDAESECGLSFIGDGVKALKLELRNASLQAETIGGYIEIKY